MGAVAGGTTLLTQLDGLIPNKLLGDDPLMEDNWNKLVDFVSKAIETMKKIDSYLPPVGFVYIQFPDQPTPGSFWPIDSPSVWSNISSKFAGLFFRAEGGNSFGFGQEQPDAFQGHALRVNVGNAWESFAVSGFRLTANDGNVQVAFNSDVTSQSWRNSGYGEPRQANETRPVNKAIRIWKRIS